MPVVGNRYYNDPQLGQAFSNLASIFAPPSGSDMAGYATAGAKKAEAQRLADLFSYARDPNFNRQTFDRLGQATGAWSPSNGYYGVDVTAATSRANNAADNERALKTNAADNTRALEQTRLGNTKDVTVSLLSPVGEGATRFVPPSIADMYGVPATQTGVLSAAQGETLVTPDNRTVQGAPKPLTDSEVKGAILQRLPENDQRNAALAGVDVEQTLDDNGKPVYTPRPEAAGKPVYTKPTNDQMSPLARLLQERDALPEGDPRRAAYDQNIAALGRGQKQSKFDEVSDEDLAKLNTTLFDNATKAVADRGTYASVLAAVNNPNVDQGTMANATLQMRKALNAFGVNAGDTGPAEMLNALGNQISLRLRDPSNGAGMPGAMSDADREFLKSMSVSLGNSPEANRLLAQYYIGIQQRAIDLNDLREKYVANHGRIDEGFRSQVSAYLKSNDPTAALRDQLSGGLPQGQPNPAAPSATAGSTQQPTIVNSPEEAMKLPSGTVIQWTENGQTVTGRVP